MPKSQKDYLPDDAHVSINGLRFLRESSGEKLRAAVTAGPLSIAQVEQLRKHFPREAVDAALILAGVQEKAREKFGVPQGGWIWAIPEALQQASSLAVARHKAASFAQLEPACVSGNPVMDLCCGMGGDAIGLAGQLPIMGVEMSEVRAFCAGANAEEFPTAHALDVVRADVRELPVGPSRCARSLFHIDPARRSGGRRSADFADLIPGPETLLRLMRDFLGGAIKLSPAVDFAELPPGHLEIISEQGSVVQAVLWVGVAQCVIGTLEHRTATVIRRGVAPFSLTGEPQDPAAPVSPLAYLYEVDASIHRAGLAPALAAKLNLQSLNADGGYLTGPGPLDHPALAAFAHVVTLPFDETHVAAALRQIPGSGPVEIKTRGKIGIDTDSLQRRLTLAAPCGATVLIYRAGGARKTMASICTRLR